MRKCGGIPIVGAHEGASCWVPREGTSLWRVLVSTRGGLVSACCHTLADWCVRSKGLMVGCETYGSNVRCTVEFKFMFTRYPRSVLRHQLGHTTSVATFKGGVAMKRGNDAGLGSPSATAHQEVVIPSLSGEVLAAARCQSRTPRRKPLRCFAAREIKEKVSWLAVRVVEKKSCTSQVMSTSVPSNACWEFPPARLGAPGREGYRRGSVQFVKQLHRVDDVAKAKADYEGDKYAKSAVESVQSRLLWWTARASEHGCG